MRQAAANIMEMCGFVLAVAGVFVLLGLGATLVVAGVLVVAVAAQVSP